MPTKKQLEDQLAALKAENEQLKADPMADHLLGNHYKNAQQSSGISVGLEPEEKAYQQRGDQFAEGAQPWEVVNPRQDLIEKHVPKGHASRFLSPSHIDTLGMRGWDPVLTKDGKQVKHANQILATMPQSKADARKQFYQEKTRRRTAELSDKHREAHERAKHAGLDTPGNELSITKTRRVIEVPA